MGAGAGSEGEAGGGGSRAGAELASATGAPGPNGAFRVGGDLVEGAGSEGHDGRKAGDGERIGEDTRYARPARPLARAVEVAVEVVAPREQGAVGHERETLGVDGSDGDCAAGRGDGDWDRGGQR